MDADFLERNVNDLPTLQNLKNSYKYFRCTSTYPPDSIPAWVTIFTGEHPAHHGWLDHVDYEDIRNGSSAYEVEKLEGHTFWDVAGARGMRVCIINPFLAYPVWNVNGVMANGPVFISGEVQVFPTQLSTDNPIPQLGGMTNFPNENELENFVLTTKKATLDLAKYGLELLDRENWDLFFISFFSLDRVQHFLWRFYDVTDPYYPGHTALENTILDFYRLFDNIVGMFLEKNRNNADVIILSDHGHGRRPLNLFNINEILRREKLLLTKEEKQIIKPKKYLEIYKNKAVNFLSNCGMENAIYLVGRLLPKKSRKALKKSSYIIDKSNSRAWASELGGGASIGGIEINVQIRRNEAEYQSTVNRIKNILLNHFTYTNQPIIKWIQTREEYMGSDEKNFYPDLIFELHEDFTVGRGLFTGIVEKNLRHKKISGGHKPEGIFFYQGDSEICEKEKISLLDIYPIILTLLGCKEDNNKPAIN